jgi:hypothetical protein
MGYIAPPVELSAVDARFHTLTLAQQIRVCDVLIIVATIPMALAVSAVLMTDAQETQYAEAHERNPQQPTSAQLALATLCRE